MSMYQFVLAMVLAAYVGFSRLYHLRFVACEPMLTGIFEGFAVTTPVPQCTSGACWLRSIWASPKNC